MAKKKSEIPAVEEPTTTTEPTNTTESTPPANNPEYPRIYESDTLPIPMYSPLWTKYVLSHLDESNEMVDGKPTCDGLRRVFHMLFNVIEATAKVITAPHIDNQSRACVEYKIVYFDLRCPMSTVRTITEAVDISASNTDIRFAKHAVATACTTAESRCYKKALKLVKVLTVDESYAADPSEVSMANLEESNVPIKARQKNVILGLCETHNIDVFALIEDAIKRKVTNVDEIKYSEAQVVLRELQAYNNGPDSKAGKAIPESLLKKG